MGLRIADFDALTFDVYGTLIDWEPSIKAFLSACGARNGVGASADDLLMSFDRARAVVQTERPAHLYPDVLRHCFERIAAEFAVSPGLENRDAFAGTPHQWPAFPDTRDGLRALQARVKNCALSNIDEASLRSSCKHIDIGFDLAVTAERVGAYKPDRPHFDTALSELEAAGIPKSRVLHVGQSLRADMAPANKLGLTCAWVRRSGRSLGLSGEGAPDARPDLTFASLAELVAALGA